MMTPTIRLLIVLGCCCHNIITKASPILMPADTGMGIDMGTNAGEATIMNATPNTNDMTSKKSSVTGSSSVITSAAKAIMRNTREEEEIEDLLVDLRDSAFFHEADPVISTSFGASASMVDPGSDLDPNADTNTMSGAFNLMTTQQKDYFLERQSDPNLICQPRHIHLSLGSEANEDEEAATSSMTISFSLPYSHNNDALAKNIPVEDYEYDDFVYNDFENRIKYNDCHPQDVHVSIWYQKIENINNHANSNVSNNSNKKNIHDTKSKQTFQTVFVPDDSVTNDDTQFSHASVINQYKVKSAKTNETYISDWIYHVQLDNLDYNSTYSYSIQVEKNENSDHKDTPRDSIGDNADIYQRQYKLTSHTKTVIDNSTSHDKDSAKSIKMSLSHGLRLKQKLKANHEHQSNLAHTKKQSSHDKQERPEQQIGMTPSFTFKTSPPPLTSSLSSFNPIKLAIVGDLGQTYNSSLTMKNILSETKSSTTTPVSLILIAGDMSYANSIQPQWDSWFSLAEPLLSQTPLVVSAGNHEIECDVLSRFPFIPYESRFRMPNRIQNAKFGIVNNSYFESQWGCSNPSQFQGTYDYGNAYYSFTYGPIKTIVLSSYSETNVNSVQYKWLENELKHNTDRNVTPWLIVKMHTQFYTTFKGHDNEFQTNEMHQSMEPLFYKYGVNFVFSGHDHAYMRSKSMYNWISDKNGPIYFIVGEGGNREHHNKYYLHDVPEEWVEVRDKTVYGFGTLEVVNRTTAHWKWIMDPNDYNASFTDDVWLSNQYYSTSESYDEVLTNGKTSMQIRPIYVFHIMSGSPVYITMLGINSNLILITCFVISLILFFTNMVRPNNSL